MMETQTIEKEMRLQRARFQMFVMHETHYERELRWPEPTDNLAHLRFMRKMAQMKRQWAFQKWKAAELALAARAAAHAFD
jgi:hypothetical protein